MAGAMVCVPAGDESLAVVAKLSVNVSPSCRPLTAQTLSNVGLAHPNLVIAAFTKGADGVLICGCYIGDCHDQEGNLKAEKRADAIRLMLADFGIEEDRFRLKWISAAEGPRFAQVVLEFTEQVRQLGVSSYKS